MLKHANVTGNSPVYTTTVFFCFWALTTWLCCPILPIHQTLHSATFSSFPKMKMKLKGGGGGGGAKISNDGGNWSRVSGCSQHAGRKWRPGIYTSESGSTAGIVAKTQKRNTFDGDSGHLRLFLFFKVVSSGIYWLHLVYHRQCTHNQKHDNTKITKVSHISLLGDSTSTQISHWYYKQEHVGYRSLWTNKQKETTGVLTM